MSGAADFKVWDSHDSLLVGQTWRAKCLHCGEIVTKYDWTREDALANAQEHLPECTRQGK